MSIVKYKSEEWVGKKFHMLTVVEPVHMELPNGGKQWFWRVQCECGNYCVVKPISIIKGKQVSCGCYREHKSPPNKLHGESHTRLHDIWCGMNNRCNPDNKNTERYGKRGICICREWKDYSKFAEWARDNGYEDGLTIERIDINGDYCPENCKWIPLPKQARNRRTTRWVEYQGRRMSLAEAAEIAGLPYKQVHFRLKAGWSLERAFSDPLRTNEDSLKMKCLEKGIPYTTVVSRIGRGWSEERALNTPTGGKGANAVTYGYDLGEAVCKVCGITFKKTNSRQLYCSTRCRNKENYKRRSKQKFHFASD